MRRLAAALVVATAAACTLPYERLVAPDAWEGVEGVEYPAEQDAVLVAIEKMLTMWEFGVQARPDPAILLDVYDRDEPMTPPNLVARIRVEPGSKPDRTKVTAIGTYAAGFGWDARYRVEDKVHQQLGLIFH